MRTRSTLRPGQPGTKRFVRRFGARLVCVRYRYDVRARRRYTTVEVIMDERPWEPLPTVQVGVRVRWEEGALRERVRASGGRWNPEERLWELSYGAVRELGLEDRVVREEAAGYAAAGGQM